MENVEVHRLVMTVPLHRLSVLAARLMDTVAARRCTAGLDAWALLDSAVSMALQLSEC